MAKKTGASDAVDIATITEYVLCYGKNRLNLKFTKNTDSYDLNRYKYQDEFVNDRGLYYIDNLDRGGLQYSDSLNYGIECPDGTVTFPNGRTEYANDGWIWKWSKQKIEWAQKNNFIEFRKSKSKVSGWAVCYKNYLNVDNEDNAIERAAPHKNLITEILNANATTIMKDLFGSSNHFRYSKPVNLIKHLLEIVTDKNITILDFFAGSGTTGQAVMELNEQDGGRRKCILVTNNENNIALNITRERLYRVINGKGSKGEKIEWEYSKEKKSLTNNAFRVFGIKHYPLTLQNLDEAEKLVTKALTEFKKLNAKYKQGSDFDIYNELSALNPYVVRSI